MNQQLTLRPTGQQTDNFYTTLPARNGYHTFAALCLYPNKAHDECPPKVRRTATRSLPFDHTHAAQTNGTPQQGEKERHIPNNRQEHQKLTQVSTTASHRGGINIGKKSGPNLGELSADEH